MFRLIYQNQVYQNTADFERDFSGFPDFALSAFAFCKAWISGNRNFLQHTSGSTGAAKVIGITRTQFIASALGTGSFFGTDPRSFLLCCLDPRYIAGKMMLVRALVWDCHVLLTPPVSNPLEELPADAEPDFAAMVPLQVQACLESPSSLGKLVKIKHLIIGGAPISSALKAKLLVHGIHAFQTYGMTETVSHVALAEIAEKELVYKTLPGVAIGVDQRDALWIKSSMSGPSPIQTNDQVRLLSPDSFQWLGRLDFVINSGGIKLNPEVLEAKAEAAVVSFFPGSAFFFHGLKDEKLGEKLVLFIEKEGENGERAKLLREELKKSLARFEVPKEIYFKPMFRKTPSGKLDRITSALSE